MAWLLHDDANDNYPWYVCKNVVSSWHRQPSAHLKTGVQVLHPKHGIWSSEEWARCGVAWFPLLLSSVPVTKNALWLCICTVCHHQARQYRWARDHLLSVSLFSYCGISALRRRGILGVPRLRLFAHSSTCRIRSGALIIWKGHNTSRTPMKGFITCLCR